MSEPASSLGARAALFLVAANRVHVQIPRFDLPRSRSQLAVP